MKMTPSLADTADQVIARLLFVPAVPPALPAAPRLRAADRAFNGSLLLSGLRCIIRYVVLPFVLPLLGFTLQVSLNIGIAIDLIALVALLFSLRQIWQARHPRRWSYLTLALVVVFAIGVFLAFDFHLLTTGR